MPDTDTLPPIAIDDWQNYQSDQFGQTTDAMLATLPTAPPSSDSLTNPLGTGNAAPPDTAPSPAPILPDLAPTPFPPVVDASAPQSPPDAAPVPPPAAASAPAVAPAPPPSTSPTEDLSPVLNAASAAGIDPGVFVAAHQSGQVDSNNFFDQATQLAGHIKDAGGDLVQGLATFTGSAANAAKVLDKAVANLNPVTSPNTSSSSQTPTQPGSGFSPFDSVILAHTPDALKNDPEFLKIVTAGAKGESGLDPNRVQQGGGGRGLWQFDINGGMGTGLSNEQLFDPNYQASKIVPLYAQAYQNAPPNLHGADLAAWVAVHVERPDDRQGQATANYKRAYDSLTPTSSSAGPPVVADQADRANASQLSQFGDKQLSTDEAYAACGPAAAVRFAEAEGRNPTLREATDLAKTVGWTSASGMAGLSSEKALMDKLGIPTKVVNGAAWDAFSREAQTGNPVTISTAGHYFYADGYNPDTGAFHVGQSGLDLKGGSEWMTPAQMTAREGAVQGGLLADNPTIANPSTVTGSTTQTQPADQQDRADASAANSTAAANQVPPSQDQTGNSTLDWLGRQKDAIASTIGGAAGAVGNAVGNALPTFNPTLDPSSPVAQQAAGNPQNPLAVKDQAVSGLADALVPPGTPVLSGAAHIALDPANLAFGPTGYLANAGGGVASDVTEQLGGDQTAQTVAGLAGGLAGGSLPIVAEHAGPALSKGLEALDALSPPNVAFASSMSGPQRALTEARQAVADLAARFPQMSPGSLAASAPGKNLAILEADAAANPDKYAALIPNANRARAIAADTQFLQDNPSVTSTDVGAGSQTRDARLLASDPNAGAEPPIGNEPFTRDPQGNIVAAPAPQEANATLQGLINQAKAKGFDTTALEAQLPKTPAVSSAGSSVADLTAKLDALGQQVPGYVAPETPYQQVQRISQQSVADVRAQAATKAANNAPPLEQFDAQGNPVNTGLAANPSQVVRPDGLGTKPGWQTIPGRQGGAVDPTASRPSLLRASEPPAELPSNPDATEPFGHTPVSRTGITPETVQIAHQRIDTALNNDPARADLAHNELDQMLAAGAAPDEVTRFLSGDVEGHTVSPTSILRSVRTGSMAGGLTTMGKVAIGPVVQVAMRAPVAAIKAVVAGRAGDIPTGLQGGLAGLAEGSQDALQTLRYGTNYRAALTGGAQGGYGFAPGLDVMGSNVAKRAAGTAAVGLVRTHGAVADITSGIGRGAALATGATPEAAGETGQQWALRSGNYGTVGQAVSNALEGLKQTNPALNVVGQILVPFYRVGYNAFTQGVERSPVGLVGTGLDVARGALGKGPYAAGADASHVTAVGDRLANNLFGVGLAGVGLAEAAQGNITGENPQNSAPKWSVRVAGQWVPLRTLGPAGEALAQSAILYESARDGKGNIPKTAEVAAAAYVGHVNDETWLRSIGDAFSTLGAVKNLASTKRSTVTSASNELAYQAGNIGKSFIPQQSLGSQIATAVGSYQPPRRKAPRR